MGFLLRFSLKPIHRPGHWLDSFCGRGGQVTRLGQMSGKMVRKWWEDGGENGKKMGRCLGKSWENAGKMGRCWKMMGRCWKIWTHHQSHEMYLLKMLGNELVISTLATWCDNHQICRKMVGIWWDNIEVQPQQSGRRLDQWTELCKWAPCPRRLMPKRPI